jgi:hypothetical protein
MVASGWTLCAGLQIGTVDPIDTSRGLLLGSWNCTKSTLQCE